jgi:hypothetical protein
MSTSQYAKQLAALAGVKVQKLTQLELDLNNENYELRRALTEVYEELHNLTQKVNYLTKLLSPEILVPWQETQQSSESSK